MVRGALDRSDRDGGKVWFPEPLALGSSLPSQMETWLRQHAINVENRWFSGSWLTAWASPAQVDWQGLNVTFGPLGLVGAGVGRGLDAVASTPFCRRGQLPGQRRCLQDDLSVSLRLVDADGQIWARREYAPPGEFAGTGRNGVTHRDDGLIIPTAAPPGD